MATGCEQLGALREDEKEFPVENGLGPIKTREDTIMISAIGGIAQIELAEERLNASERRSEETFAALKRSEELLKRAQRLAHIGSTVRDLRSGEAIWSDEAYRIFGTDRETWVPTTENFVAMLHPDDRAKVLATLDQAAPLEVAQAPYECRIIRPDGQVRYLHRQNEIDNDEAELAPAAKPRYTRRF